MNVIDLLKKDHEKVKTILEALKNTTERSIKTREEKLNILKKEFIIHAQFEEKVFYPSVKAEDEIKNLVLEAYEEHYEVKIMLKELDKLALDDERWKARLTVIKENIEHHIKEEENDLFPKIKKLIPAEKLEEMAEQLKKFKEQHK